MITDKIKKIIEFNPVSFATTDSSGNPNVIGVAFVKVVSPSQIIITDNFMKQTIDNIKNNQNVCLATWDKDWDGYKFIGNAEYFTEGQWKEYVDKMPENEGLPTKGAIMIQVSKVIKLG